METVRKNLHLPPSSIKAIEDFKKDFGLTTDTKTVVAMLELASQKSKVLTIVKKGHSDIVKKLLGKGS